MQVRAIALAVIRRPVTSDVRVQSRASPCGHLGICGGQNGAETSSPSRVLKFYHVIIIQVVPDGNSFIADAICLISALDSVVK